MAQLGRFSSGSSWWLRAVSFIINWLRVGVSKYYFLLSSWFQLLDLIQKKMSLFPSFPSFPLLFISQTFIEHVLSIQYQVPY